MTSALLSAIPERRAAPNFFWLISSRVDRIPGALVFSVVVRPQMIWLTPGGLRSCCPPEKKCCQSAAMRRSAPCCAERLM